MFQNQGDPKHAGQGSHPAGKLRACVRERLWKTHKAFAVYWASDPELTVLRGRTGTAGPLQPSTGSDAAPPPDL